MDTIKINKGNILMVAHAGLAGLECENTCAGFVAAGNRSYYAIETDFRVTKDGKFVTIHNESTDQLSAGVDLKVSESTLEELQSLVFTNPRTGESRADLRPASLEEYIGICKRYDKVAIPELKGVWTEEQIKNFIDVIKSFDYLEKTIFLAFEWDNIEIIRKIVPGQKVQYLRYDNCDEEAMQLMINNKVDADLAHPWVTQEIVDRLHEAGLKVNCWTCDDEGSAQRMINFGVDYITSNFLE